MTLFELLACGERERMHTQTLSWLLTPTASPLVGADRLSILRALGVDCESIDPSRLRTATEVDRIDLICWAPGLLVGIENKIRSRQGKGQLEDYDKRLYSIAKRLKVQVEPKKILLTISKERAHGNWSSVDYSMIVPALEIAAARTCDRYVVDYARLVRRIIDARDAFVKEPGSFREIARRVAMSNLDRIETEIPPGVSTTERFACENRLERVFVEALLIDLTKEMSNVTVVSGATGRPLVQVYLFLVEIACGRWYRVGVQLQNGSLKLNISHIDYERSSRSSVLGSLVDSLDRKFSRKRVNGDRGRDYRSWSVPAPEDLRYLEVEACVFRGALDREIQRATADWKSYLEDALSRRWILGYLKWDHEYELSLLGEAANSTFAVSI